MNHQDKILALDVAFRVDASTQIGTGHVMRCLTLAKALRFLGAECVFLCRDHDGHLLDLIADDGFQVIVLAGPFDIRACDPDAAALAHADWLGVSWKDDAADSHAALSSHFADSPVDWLVVDHYALDARWERALRSSCARLMVIDDLSDRSHDCDLLLDQNLGREAADYAGRIPEGATALTGPGYALLRPEFARLRDQSLAHRAEPKLERLLVTLGGVDRDNVTTCVLDALDNSSLPEAVRVTVVMGPHAPWLDAVRIRAARMRLPTEVLVGVRDMARLMAESDLAIGAGGTTTWERCALGVPAIQVALAENQREINAAIGAAKAAITCDVAGIRDAITDFLETPSLFEQLADMCHNSAEVTDGQGAERVTGYVIGDMK